ncbi:hypothetical protein SAY87_016721 [Trapa incisa]|uniref:RING-type E3 ubiquitin transferase n=1 Tax=Trapa incisa TaxID=236973 RepID=A0AAN7L916_9MYRT|nr:hypothetical protein SAY87_016721 [Trapa incisa]
MDETMATPYWCHMCSQLVNPIIEAEIKCPYCRDGFVEEMSSATREAQEEDGSDFRSERGLYPRIPVVRRRRRTRGLRFADEDDGEADDMQVRLWGDYSELGHDMDSIIQRRRRSSAMILQLLQDL